MAGALSLQKFFVAAVVFGPKELCTPTFCEVYLCLSVQDIPAKQYSPSWLRGGTPSATDVGEALKEAGRDKARSPLAGSPGSRSDNFVLSKHPKPNASIYIYMYMLNAYFEFCPIL